MQGIDGDAMKNSKGNGRGRGRESGFGYAQDMRTKAIKNLTGGNTGSVVTPKKVFGKMQEDVIEQNADDVLRNIAINRLRKKGMAISRDGAVTNDGKGNIQAGSVV
ncbi:MAG: hypothetical protein DRG59_12185 [Deltaproteobacteria bacterium]|nr:MAG: hypothetical protein DRG59_12185 [Deltaproteobacteria bacterium]